MSSVFFEIFLNGRGQRTIESVRKRKERKIMNKEQQVRTSSVFFAKEKSADTVGINPNKKSM